MCCNVTYSSSLQELLLAGFAILLLATPCLEGGGLQGTAVGETQLPGPMEGNLVDGIQVQRGLLLGLTA